MPDSNNSESSTATKGTAAGGAAGAVKDPPPGATASLGSAWDEDFTTHQANQKPWHGWDGLSVMTFGVAVPFFLFVLSAFSAPKRLTLVILNLPLETITEMLLILSIPLTIYTAWSSLCRGTYLFKPRRGVALGAAIGTSLIIASISGAGMFAACKSLAPEIGTEFTTGFCFMGVLSALAAACGIYIAYRVRQTLDFAISRRRVVLYTAVGAVLSLLAFVGAEFRPFCIRIAERMTVNNSAATRRRGFDWLRQLNVERELRMECSDSRAAGLAGFFIPLKSGTLHQLYFAVTGKPYSFRDSNNSNLSSMPDDYLSRNVVGDKVLGLALVRSSLTGSVHPETLTSTINWTLVFKNDSDGPRESRAEIAVPPGAAINGLTLWAGGEPHKATFAASGKIDGVSHWVEANSSSPAMIADLGRGRVLLHCYPIEEEGELKVRMTMVVPLSPDGDQTATLTLPHLIATNFDLSGEHELRLRSDLAINTGLTGVRQSNGPNGQKILSGELKQDQLSSTDLMVTVNRPAIEHPIAVVDSVATLLKHQSEMQRLNAQQKETANALSGQQVMVMVDGSKNVERQVDDVTRALAEKVKARSYQVHVVPLTPQYVVENVKRTSARPPGHLVVVLDGSITLKPHSTELASALARIPSNIPVSLIVASQEQENLMHPVAMMQGLKNFKSVQFTGGQDNLEAVVKGAELAGETEGGALLWVHGPQPVLNREIYIMAPYEAVPRFYEMAIDSGDTDTVEFFKNHSEIGPFTPVPRNAGVAADLDRFFAKWKTGSSDYSVDYSALSSKPSNTQLLSTHGANEIIALHANAECLRLLSDRQTQKAARLALAYGLVTPVSSAIVPSSNQSQNDGSTSEGASGNDQTGASNGTETESSLTGATTTLPQACDSMVVQGINTAGTVRVNNLANLEALFNIISNLVEIIGIAIGGIMTLQAIVVRTTCFNWLGTQIELTPAKRLAVGVTILIAALTFPGLLNWFVASARDANLFS